jgi:sugar lactone lactonase YvrE
MRRLILLLALLLASATSPTQAAAPGTVITIAGNGTIGFSGDGGPATNASFNAVEGLAYGPDGTLYIADGENVRVRAVDPITGNIRTIAGTGTPGDEGNGGLAINANLGGVIGLATDRARNALYITDWPNNWIRKVNLNDGVISLYAGSGGFGMSGDGGPATSAKLRFPIDAATDAAGRLSFVDSNNKRICRVDPVTGIISTIAGSADLGPTGDGGPATSAALGNPIRLAADPAGNVYVRDGDPNGAYFTVRRIDATSGIITTIVGGGSNPEGTGVATSMLFKNIGSLAANGEGELFLSTSLRVYTLNIASGIIAPFAGDGTSGFSVEGAPALTAKFANITALAVAPDGGLAIADTDNARVRLVVPQPKQPATSSDRVIAIAGNGTVGFSGDGGPALHASFNLVQGLVFGGDGTLYLSDTGNLRIRAVDPSTGNIRTIAGTGAVGEEGNGGPAINATMKSVIGLGADPSRNALYLPEFGNQWVRKINLNDGIISVYAGTGTSGFSGDGGPATLARLRLPVSAATDALGRLYFCDVSSWRVRRVDANGIIETVAGSGVSGVPSGDGGPATSAIVGSPLRLTADPAGNVYLRDGDPNGGNYVVRRIDATTGIIRTIVGGGTNALGAGIATSMYFHNIVDVAANDAGELFVATDLQVFKHNIATGMIAPFAGDGASGPTTNGAPALTARFEGILALAVAPGGGVVVADLSSRVYRIGPYKQPAVSSGSIITIAGNGMIGFSGDGGPAISASIGSNVSSPAFGPDGTLYFADFDNWRIRAVDPFTGNIRTVAGSGTPDFDGYGGGDRGLAINATFGGVYGLAVDRARNVLYFSDDGNNRVRKVDLTSGIISGYAGTGILNGAFGYAGDGGPATEAKMRQPMGLAVDATGRLLIADVHNYAIRPVDPITGIISTIAGAGDACSNAGDGGLAKDAFFSLPVFLHLDARGNIFVHDGGGPCGTNNPPTTIRRIDALTGIITRIGGGGTSPIGNGVPTTMDFAPVNAHAVDPAGNVYLAIRHQIFKLDAQTGLLSLFAGNVDGAGPLGDGGPASAAAFGTIYGLAVAPGGGLVVTDGPAGRIRYIAPESISLSGDAAQTSFTLPWAHAISGNLVIEDNANLTAINLASLTTVSGDLVLQGNAAAGDLDLGSLETASGDLIITDNTAATVINLASLTTVSGDLTLENNGVSGNLDLGSLETVSGDLTVEEPASGNLDLGSLAEVSGDLTLESNESGNLDLSTLTEYGCIVTNEVTMTLDGSFAMTNGITLCTNATLAGNATVDGSVTNNGTIEPGSSPGRLNFLRNLHLGASSRLNLEIGGYAPTQIDTINVGDNTVLGGTLTIRILDTFTSIMTNGASFTVLTSAQPLTGAFANVASGSTLTSEDGRARFTVLYAGQNSVQLTDLQINNDAPQLRILSISKQPGALRITWTAVPGTTYRVQSAANLQDGFTDQSPSITAGATDTTLQYEAPTSAETTRFFIIRALP